MLCSATNLQKADTGNHIAVVECVRELEVVKVLVAKSDLMCKMSCGIMFGR